jgi:hypothetical protein
MSGMRSPHTVNGARGDSTAPEDAAIRVGAAGGEDDAGRSERPRRREEEV